MKVNTVTNAGLRIATLCPRRTLSALVCSALLSVHAQVSPNEFWVSSLPNSNPTPTGTIADPYDGSTQPKFDTVMNAMSANCTIHLLGGTYFTRGESGFFVKTGQKILGSGMDITTVTLTNTGTSTIFYNAANSNFWGSGIEICDLTCDANAQNLASSNTYAAIWIIGSDTKIRRVKAKGLAHGGFQQTSEVFGIMVGGGDNLNADDVVVDDCVVLPPVYGPVCTSIAVGSGTNSYVSARISGNWVYGTNTTLVQAIGVGNDRDLLVSGNHVVNVANGIRSEVGNTNLTVVNNYFKNIIGYAFALEGSPLCQNIYIAGNTFEMMATNGFGHVFNQSSPVINEKVIGNTMKNYGAPGTNLYALVIDNATNLVIADNSIDSTYYWSFVGCTNVILRDNVDLFGNFLSSTNQIKLPNSLTRRTISTSSDTAQYLDHYIGVQTAGMVTITLPSPAGHNGKEYIIVNERGSGTINIAASPAMINGASSTSFSASYGSRTVVTDGSNWFAR